MKFTVHYRDKTLFIRLTITLLNIHDINFFLYDDFSFLLVTLWSLLTASFREI